MHSLCRENGLLSENKKAKLLHGVAKIHAAQMFTRAKSLMNGAPYGNAPKNGAPSGSGMAPAPLQVKSILRPPNAKHKGSRRKVRFKGMVSFSYVQLVAVCVRYTRSGSQGAAWWELFIAWCGKPHLACCNELSVSDNTLHGAFVVSFHKASFCRARAVDFFCVPLALVSKAYQNAFHLAHLEAQGVNFTLILAGIDVLFLFNILVSLSQACSDSSYCFLLPFLRHDDVHAYSGYIVIWMHLLSCLSACASWYASCCRQHMRGRLPCFEGFAVPDMSISGQSTTHALGYVCRPMSGTWVSRICLWIRL
jgi:hypothetical protein